MVVEGGTAAQGSRPRTVVLSLLIVVAIAMAFGRIAGHEFTWWDDHLTIHHNPRLNPPSVRNVKHYWLNAEHGLYIPVTYTAWGVLAAAGGVDAPAPLGIRLDPRVFHVASLLVHAGAALVVLALLRRLLQHDWAAVTGALVFALHPVQVEAVAWASGLKDVLAGLLGLVAVWQYVVATSDDERDAHSSNVMLTRPYAIATAAFVLAMLAKPSAIVVPLIVATIDLLLLKRFWRTSLHLLWPWLLLMIPCALWTRAAQTTIVPPDVPLWTRPLVALDALASYLFKLFVPWRFGIDYGRTPERIVETGWAYWTWILPAAIAAALVVWHRRRPVLTAGAAVFALGVLPVLGFAPFMFQYFSTVADHYLYLSMLGTALAAGTIAARCDSPMMRAVAVVVLVGLAVRSFIQAGTWRDHVTLMEHAVSVNPRSVAAYNNLGAYAAQILRQPEQAAEYYRRTLEIRPDEPKALDGLATALLQQGHYDEAADVLERLIPLLPQLGRAQEADVAREAVRQLRDQRPPPVRLAPTTNSS